MYVHVVVDLTNATFNPAFPHETIESASLSKPLVNTPVSGNYDIFPVFSGANLWSSSSVDVGL